MGFNLKLTPTGIEYFLRSEAGEHFNIDRIVFGEGQLPPDATVDSMTDMVAPVFDVASVAKVPMKKVLRLIIDYTDAVIPHDFWHRELAIYASVGEQPSALYAYGNVGDAAEYIRASGAADGRILDTLVTVANAANVTISAGESVAYVPIYDRATAEDIEMGTPYKWLDAEGAKLIQAPILTGTLSIPAASWQAGNNGKYKYYADYAIDGITGANTGLIDPDDASLDIAIYAGMRPRADTMGGKLRLWCEDKPTDAISGEYTIFGASGGMGGGTGGGNYVLPIASPTTLGGVKIGDNVAITPDGTISAGTELTKEQMVTSDEVKAMLDAVFGTE